VFNDLFRPGIARLKMEPESANASAIRAWTLWQSRDDALRGDILEAAEDRPEVAVVAGRQCGWVADIGPVQSDLAALILIVLEACPAGLDFRQFRGCMPVKDVDSTDERAPPNMASYSSARLTRPSLSASTSAIAKVASAFTSPGPT